MIPAGKYLARPIHQKSTSGDLMAMFGHSAKKGTPQVTVAFEILDGEHKDETVYWTGYFTDGALKNTMKALRAIGFVGDDLDTFNDQDPLTLKNVELDVQDEPAQNGKTYTRVAWVNRPRASMGRDDLRTFAAEMKDKIAQYTDEAAPADDSFPPGDDVLF